LIGFIHFPVSIILYLLSILKIHSRGWDLPATNALAGPPTPQWRKPMTALAGNATVLTGSAVWKLPAWERPAYRLRSALHYSFGERPPCLSGGLKSLAMS